MLHIKLQALKRACDIKTSQPSNKAINLLDSTLVSSLPSDSQLSIRNFLSERINKPESFQRALKFR